MSVEAMATGRFALKRKAKIAASSICTGSGMKATSKATATPLATVSSFKIQIKRWRGNQAIVHGKSLSSRGIFRF